MKVTAVKISATVSMRWSVSCSSSVRQVAEGGLPRPSWRRRAARVLGGNLPASGMSYGNADPLPKSSLCSALSYCFVLKCWSYLCLVC